MDFNKGTEKVITRQFPSLIKQHLCTATTKYNSSPTNTSPVYHDLIIYNSNDPSEHVGSINLGLEMYTIDFHYNLYRYIY